MNISSTIGLRHSTAASALAGTARHKRTACTVLELTISSHPVTEQRLLRMVQGCSGVRMRAAWLVHALNSNKLHREGETPTL